MFMRDEEVEEQIAHQRQMEAFKKYIEEQSKPTQITLMVHDIYCWPIFPVASYVAATVFGISPEEFQQKCSQKVNTQNEEASE